MHSLPLLHAGRSAKVTYWLLCSIILGTGSWSELAPLEGLLLQDSHLPHSSPWSQVSPLLGTGLLVVKGCWQETTITLIKEAHCSSRKLLSRNALRTFKTASSVRRSADLGPISFRHNTSPLLSEGAECALYRLGCFVVNKHSASMSVRSLSP